MKKRNTFIFCITFIMMILPAIIKASSLLSSYGETVTKANNYITNFRDRRKYLIFNKNYVYEKTGFGDTSSFTNGGLLSKSEFDLSIINNQSYLANGKEYWTLTSDGANKYYIDAYIQSKGINSLSGTRVTEFIKPGTIYSGRGTYSNPWVFDEGYSVDVISNNTNFGIVEPLGERYVRPGATLSYVLTPKNGYYYNTNKDECDFVKDGGNIYENNYLIEDIERDISCTAVFELQTYKFDLLIDPNLKDYNGNPLQYATTPNPNPIYYKYKTNWYSDSQTKNAIAKITMPTITGYSVNGYYYGNTRVIDNNGNLTDAAKNLELTDFVETNHILYITGVGDDEGKGGLTVHTYTVKYNLNGGTLNGKTSVDDETYSYDYVIIVNNAKKAGNKFDGWSHNGNSFTARTGSTLRTLTTNFTAGRPPLIAGTVTRNKYFVNLTPTQDGIVTMKANFTACPVGSFNIGDSIDCTACPTGMTTDNAGSTSKTNCKITCSVGTYLKKNESSCTTCPKGSYCAGGTYYFNDSSDQGIVKCPGSMTTASTGSSLKTQCRITCVAGTYLNKNESACSNCLANNYCVGGDFNFNTTSNQGIATCNSLNTDYIASAEGSDEAKDCYIPKDNLKGKYVATANANSIECAADGYCPGTNDIYFGSAGGRNLCTSLNTDYIKSDKGSDEAKDCYIPKDNLKGKYVKTANNNSEACAQNYYCTGESDIHYGSIGGSTACPSTYPNTETTGASLRTKCRKSNSCTKKDADHDECKVTGSYSTTTSCTRTDCNHTGCIPGGTYSYTGSCSCTAANCSSHSTCTCVESTNGKTCGYTVGDSCPGHRTSGSCDAPDPTGSTTTYGMIDCVSAAGVINGQQQCAKTPKSCTTSATGTYSCTQSANCSTSNAGSYTSCTCSGTYTSSASCSKTDADHTGCTVTGTYYTYSPN